MSRAFETWYLLEQVWKGGAEITVIEWTSVQDDRIPVEVREGDRYFQTSKGTGGRTQERGGKWRDGRVQDTVQGDCSDGKAEENREEETSSCGKKEGKEGVCWRRGWKKRGYNEGRWGAVTISFPFQTEVALSGSPEAHPHRVYTHPHTCTHTVSLNVSWIPFARLHLSIKTEMVVS